MIEVENLVVSFGTRTQVPAVRGIGFAVAPGSAFGIAGESGSGKSTILRVLSGLNRRWSGRVVIAGAEQGPLRPRSFSRQLQMVFQDPYGSLHPRRTINQMLREIVAVHGLERAEDRIDGVLGSVGLPRSLRFRYPHQLSGGQRQRVAIARALILEPRILLLDEPTSALDVSVQAEILNLLTRLRRDRGLTYVLVSHNLAVIAHLCDRVAVMQQGEFVETVFVQSMQDRKVSHPYTRDLLHLAHGVADDPGRELL